MNIYQVKIKQPTGETLRSIIAATAIKARITAMRMIDITQPFSMVVRPAGACYLRRVK